MKNIKLYNVLFPLFSIYLIPPIALLILISNFIVDSLVIILCFYLFKLKNYDYSLKQIYEKSIILVWVFGFISDFIGDILVLVFAQGGFSFNLPYEISAALNTNVFDNPFAFIIVFIIMLIVGFLIFILNYFITFRKLIEEKNLRLKVALSIGIITIPWAFLIPSEILYNYIQ